MRSTVRIGIAFVTLAWILSACAGVAPVQSLEVSPNPEMVLSGKITGSPHSEPATEPGGGIPKTGLSPTPSPSSCPRIALQESILINHWVESQRANHLVALDPKTGARLCTPRNIRFKQVIATATSPDWNTLAVVDFSSDYYQDGTLHLVDLQTWEAVTTTIRITGVVHSMEFNPAGQQLAIVTAHQNVSPPETQHSILLVDLPAQRIVARRELHFQPHFLKYSPDGESLILFGSSQDKTSKGPNSQGQFVSLDTEILDVQWGQEFPDIRIGLIELEREETDPFFFESWQPAIVYAPESMHLYIVHADSDRLTTIDLRQRTASTINIQPEVSWLERLLSLGVSTAHAKAGKGTWKQAILSKDGQRLYITGQINDIEKDEMGNWQPKNTPLALQAVEIHSGQEIARLDNAGGSISLSVDGELLYLRGWMEDRAYTDILDAGSLEVLQRVEGESLLHYWTAGGQPVLVSERTSEAWSEIVYIGSWDQFPNDSLEEAGAWRIEGFPIQYAP